jgi:magnesium transporter
VARLVRRYHFAALPVVDAERRLVGVISGDDVLDVATEEATEDMYRMVGLPADEVAAAPAMRIARRRLPWLLINLATAFFGALTVSAFEDTISRVAALAIFMPVIAGQAGNTGSQIATIMVRGLALGEVKSGQVWTILSRQLPFGLLAGLTTGLLSAGLALLLTGNGWLGLVVTVAMVGNVLIATAAGTLIPLILRWLRLDPALSAMIWLTAVTDIMGFVLLLGMGALLVERLS